MEDTADAPRIRKAKLEPGDCGPLANGRCRCGTWSYLMENSCVLIPILHMYIYIYNLKHVESCRYIELKVFELGHFKVPESVRSQGCTEDMSICELEVT